MELESDEPRRERNLAKHGLDFTLAALIFDGRPRFDQLSDHPGEVRYLSTALIEFRFMTVVWTWRHESVRVISLRRARNAEERAYRAIHD